MIVAGEASGDRLGADLVNALRKRAPEANFFGTPGPAMRTAGVESVSDSDTWSVVGIGAVIWAIPKFLRIKAELLRSAGQRHPDAVVLIDFPEFNLKLAKSLKKRGHRVIFYVSPQLWAWRKYRIRTIRDSVDLLLSILPFEQEWYSGRGVEHVRYVGNPVATRTKPTIERYEFRTRLGILPDEPLIALLPGSREKEIERHLPVMNRASKLLRDRIPSSRFAIAAADERMADLVSRLLGSENLPAVSLVKGETIDLLNAADAAAISSGTATLEAGVLNTPMVVVYKVPRTDYHLFRHFVDVQHFALINLVAGRKIACELIQDEFNAEALADEIERLLEKDVNEEMRRDLKAATDQLTTSTPSEDAADAILELLRKPSKNDSHS